MNYDRVGQTALSISLQSHGHGLQLSPSSNFKLNAPTILLSESPAQTPRSYPARISLPNINSLLFYPITITIAILISTPCPPLSLQRMQIPCCCEAHPSAGLSPRPHLLPPDRHSFRVYLLQCNMSSNCPPRTHPPISCPCFILEYPDTEICPILSSSRCPPSLLQNEETGLLP